MNILINGSIEDRDATQGTVTLTFDSSSATSAAQVGPLVIGGGVLPRRPGRTGGAQKKLESAVYAHIQAVRALGRTRVDTAEIARALGLTLAEVEQTIAGLRKKGVKAV